MKTNQNTKLNKDNRSIAEVIMDGDGRYSTLVKVDKLDDGTYLVYEKEKLFGPWKAYMRVHRLDPNNKEPLRGAVVPQYHNYSDEEVIRTLRSYILSFKL